MFLYNACFIFELSAELVKQLEEAKRSTGKPTLVIAHSMGGLVALHALARAPDPTIFKGIIFGSTPFNGTPNILQPFKHGDSILMNKDICSPSTVFCGFRQCSFPSLCLSTLSMNRLHAS